MQEKRKYFIRWNNVPPGWARNAINYANNCEAANYEFEIQARPKEGIGKQVSVRKSKEKWIVKVGRCFECYRFPVASHTYVCC